MKSPYEILDVKSNANDAEIKQAYLKKVKDNPPDHHQEQFQLIHQAYTLIKDNKSRLSHELFTLPTANFDGIINQALKPEQTISFGSEQFNKLLCTSMDETTLINAIAKSEH